MSTKSALRSAPCVESRVQQELASQLDTAVAFADFCTLLTAGRLSAQATPQVALAQALYAETTTDLARSRPQG